MTTSIGFIGLGTMGCAMAANLLSKGYDVTVYNRTAAKAEQLQSLGAAVAATPADAARSRSVVITMVSNDDSIRDVYDGESGIFSAVSEGTVIVDSSTISPDLARRLAADAASRGAVFLDAPDDRDATTVHLGVEERVDDVDRDLVAELRAPLRVADDQDVRHAAEPSEMDAPCDCDSRGRGAG